MRMRHKKHLEERLAACAEMFVGRESENFYRIPVEDRNFVVDLRKIFGNDNPIILEIGCGKGSFAVKSAKLHPENNYIAVEKLSNVIIVGCERAQGENIENLRFLNCAAENLLFFLPQNSISEIILNFSCPFPKKGYTNRRLTYGAFLEKYKQLLKKGGTIRQKTDDVEFFEFSLEQYAKYGFEVKDVTYDLHSGKSENTDDAMFITTEYEEKFMELGKKICACTAVFAK